jgi:methionyl-tRNA formyltransferase
MVRIGFIGCHEISWHCLKKICDLSYRFGDQIVLVFNLDEKEAVKHSAFCRFDTLQNAYRFPLHYVSDVSDPNNIELLKQSNPDILFIIGWHKIVPQEVLDTATIRLGIHSSLLPKDRGPSPINWQIIRGETLGGVTLFHLTTGVDAGDIVDSEAYKIEENDTVADVYSKATISSISLLDKNWGSIHNMTIKAVHQNEKDATLNPRRKPKDGLIDWSKDSLECYNWIRALTRPYPGAFTYWNNKKVIIWSSKINNSFTNREPGTIININEKLTIATGKGCIDILKLQVENEPICDAKLFIKSYALQENDHFTCHQINS